MKNQVEHGNPSHSAEWALISGNWHADFVFSIRGKQQGKIF